ncbi:MAG TPA: nitrous oxide reductase accessory protein NosL [Telmatospirillum sp.]|nr:nitrous oxide reductase accessory protein NosL [Telmatospirillum sp.]
MKRFLPMLLKPWPCTPPSRTLLATLAILSVAACGPTKQAEQPPPAPFDAQASAHFCGMAVGEHPGPKGQVWLDDQKQPLWFSSVHDTIAFTLLPEEPKNIRVIYVSDMTKAPSWDRATEGGWVDARTATYVVGSRTMGGMGITEEVPFSDKAAAETFARRNGGKLVAFDDIPKDDILGTPASAGTPERER